MRLWVEMFLRLRKFSPRSRQPPCEAVSWNMLSVSSTQTGSRSASLWGCELKCWITCTLMRRSWCQPPCEAVSWNVSPHNCNCTPTVSLLVRLWVEIRNRKRPTSQMWSASLWGCELKCRVPRIWLFHCNRQIILRSGIKSLQPFERWSNLLQVTCDLW